MQKIIFAAALLWSGTAWSQAGMRSDVDALVPTVGMSLGAGYAVHKSELVESNDTATSFHGELSFAAGTNRATSVTFQHETSAFAFKLNDSSLKTGFTDIFIRQRVAWFHLGLILSHSSLIAEQEFADASSVLEVASNGFGGNLGVSIPIGKIALVNLDASLVQPSKLFTEPWLDEATDQYYELDVKAAQRVEVDIKGSIQIFKYLRGILGLKWRTFGFDIEGETSKEQTTINYFGLGSGVQF